MPLSNQIRYRDRQKRMCGMLSGIHSALHPVPFRHFISVRTRIDVDECGSHCMKVGRNPKFLLHLDILCESRRATGDSFPSPRGKRRSQALNRRGSTWTAFAVTGETSPLRTPVSVRCIERHFPLSITHEGGHQTRLMNGM